MRRGLLYLGTENGIYVSFDDGDTWQPLQNDLPHAPVYGIVMQEHFNDLVIATYGRGFWILDDITPLQKLTPDVTASAATLFAPRAAYRFRGIDATSTRTTIRRRARTRRTARPSTTGSAPRAVPRAWRFWTPRERPCARFRARRAPA